MDYLEKKLMGGEKLLYRTRLHWIVFLWPSLWLLVAIGLIYSPFIYRDVSASFFVFLSLFTGAESVVGYFTTAFALTNKRVMIKVGFIRRISSEIFLHRIEGIQVEQGMTGRMLGFGSIVVRGEGGTRDPLLNISDPLEFGRKTQQQVDILQKKVPER